jgi:hypothetical protein
VEIATEYGLTDIAAERFDAGVRPGDIVSKDRRSLGEVAMMRSKALIGHRPNARTLPTQKTEAAAACKVLNIMTNFGMPVSQRIA